jgi:hypothetical protein
MVEIADNLKWKHGSFDNISDNLSRNGFTQAEP